MCSSRCSRSRRPRAGASERSPIFPCCELAARGRVSVVQLLPVNEMAAGETSPYRRSARWRSTPSTSAFDDVGDFRRAEGKRGYARRAGRAPVGAGGGPRRLRGGASREGAALQLAFSISGNRVDARHRPRRRVRGLLLFEEWWLADYALYRALRERYAARSWTDWDAPLRNREPGALDDARRELEREVLVYQYLQWIAEEQWQDARAAAAPSALRRLPVHGEHRQRGRLGTPASLPVRSRPSACPRTRSARPGRTGGFPSIAGIAWPSRGMGGWSSARAAARACSTDTASITSSGSTGRTRGRSGSRRAVRSGRRSGAARAGRAADAICSSRRGAHHRRGPRLGARVRARVADKPGMPGYKVVRWEREWDTPGQPFRDPAAYPALAVGTTGTHDTDPNATWWEQAPPEERQAFAELAAVRGALTGARRRTRPSRPRCATRSSRCSTAHRRACCSSRSRMCSAGPTAINTPANRRRRQLVLEAAVARGRPRRRTRRGRTRRLPEGPGRGDGQGPRQDLTEVPSTPKLQLPSAKRQLPISNGQPPTRNSQPPNAGNWNLGFGS